MVRGREEVDRRLALVHLHLRDLRVATLARRLVGAPQDHRRIRL
jgi:hypothetical protein